MNFELREQKKDIRATMLEKRDAFPRQMRKDFSNLICEKLWQITQARKAKVLHTFLPMGSEVMLFPFIQKSLENHIKVVAPKTLKGRKMQNLVVNNLKSMEPGIFGTYHPKDGVEYNGTFDLIIVAGLAFDKEGYRVGYGGGYYDVFLAECKNAWKVGVCFPFQIVNKVPVESHDIPVNELVLIT
ncbi:MAG: 5-formyltetrahydrofolate cyclo-ligase [Saprospiraceae bacterium]